MAKKRPSPGDDRVTHLPGIGRLSDTQFAGYAAIEQPPKSGNGYKAPKAPQSPDPALFYWFAGPEDYTRHPVILWSNGGPGSSSLWGFFIENGPYVFAEQADGQFAIATNPDGWNRRANYLVFEHPLGVTLSFHDDAATLPQNVEEGIVQLYQALLGFYARHPELLGNPLVLAGESYAGTYLPLLARAIRDGNGRDGNPVLDLRTVVLADAWVDPMVQMATDTTYALNHGLITPGQKAWLDEKYRHNYPQINQAIQQLCGLYMANIAQSADPPFQPVLDYINRPDVRAAIHVGSAVPVTASWSEAIANLYAFGVNDSYAATVQQLLEDGLQFIVVSGLNDAKDCNFLGTGAWLDRLEGDVAQRFHHAQTELWKNPAGDVLGYVQDGGGLSWIKVLNAGHLAVRDQPRLIDLLMAMSRAWPVQPGKGKGRKRKTTPIP